LRMSAFAVAIGGKADMRFCNAHVGFWPKADIWLRYVDFDQSCLIAVTMPLMLRLPGGLPPIVKTRWRALMEAVTSLPWRPNPCVKTWS